MNPNARQRRQRLADIQVALRRMVRIGSVDSLMSGSYRLHRAEPGQQEAAE